MKMPSASTFMTVLGTILLVLAAVDLVMNRVDSHTVLHLILGLEMFHINQDNRVMNELAEIRTLARGVWERG